MLSSITPLGERSKGNRFSTTFAFHLLGSAIGGALLGVSAAAIGSAIRVTLAWDDRAAAAVVAVGALGAMGVDLWWTATHRLVSWRRQVNEQWLDDYRAWVYAGGFGLQLGAGVVTIITSATTYAAVLAAIVQPTFARGVAVGMAFGAVRGLTLLSVARVEQPAQLLHLHRRLAQAASPVARAVAWGAGSVGVVGLALAVSGVAG